MTNSYLTKKDMRAMQAWHAVGDKKVSYYDGFDDYYDAFYGPGGRPKDLTDAMRYEYECKLKHQRGAAKRKAEVLAQEAIAQAMLSPGAQVVIQNPGTTQNPAHLTVNGQQVAPMYTTAGSCATTITNYNTAWTNILVNYGVGSTASWEAIDASPAPQMIGIADDGRIELPRGRQVKMPLGDGSTLYVDKEGNFSIDDKDAKVIYKANRIREFNPYINASDLLIKFMEYARSLGLDLKKEDVMQLDIGLFVNWLIIEAAERDQDPVPTDIVVTQQKRLKGKVLPRCILPTCHRFIPRQYAAAQFPFCNPAHAEAHIKRLAA